jgi:dTMP kinase
MKPEQGKYIVIEGSDGTGKSTQALRVTERLAHMGYDPLVVFNYETGRMEPLQEPGGTPHADRLRRRIKDKSIERTPWENVEWFTEARQSAWQEAILPALEAGRPVVTSRSWISTVAYQGYGEGVSLEEIARYTEAHVGRHYMSPDLVCILALQNEQVRAARLTGRGESQHTDTFESKPEQFQRDMQTGYVRFAADNGINVIGADGSPDEVFETIWAQVSATLAKS